MATTSSDPHYRLRVSAFDRVSSLLFSLLAMTGLTVAGLVFLYFARQLATIELAIPVKPVELTGGGGGGQGAGDMLADAGGALDMPELGDFPQPAESQLLDTLDVIADAVERKSSLVLNEQLDVVINPDATPQDYIDTRRPGLTGAGGGRGTGIGTGTGSGRGPGTGGGTGGGFGLREPDREIRFEPENLLEYAQFLDYHKIELGVLGRDNKIHYAYNLSQRVPGVREGVPAEEQRLYMNSARSRFAALDHRLASRAGIADLGRIILQFYPEQTQAILYELERARAQAAGRQPEDVLRTVYRVTRNGDRFDINVEEQFYR